MCILSGICGSFAYLFHICLQFKDLCVLFVWCLLGAAQACGRAVSVLERSFCHHQAVVIILGGWGGGHSSVLVVDYLRNFQMF